MPEWDNEPNRLEWESNGLKCLMRRGGGGAWCGYVGVTGIHPAYGIGYSGDESPVGCKVQDIAVHGGLTFAEQGDGDGEDGWPAGYWWFGFDCAHSHDLIPRWTDMARLFEDIGGGRTYRNVAYVQRETERLAAQLAHIAESTDHIDRMSPDELRALVRELEAKLSA